MVEWIVEHWDLLAALAALVVALVGLTGWGQAHAVALRKVLEAVELCGAAFGSAQDVKRTVAASEAGITPAAQAALHEMVRVVDPKKRTPLLVGRVLRVAAQVMKGLVRRR